MNCVCPACPFLQNYANHHKFAFIPVTYVALTNFKMFDKVLEGTKAEAMLVGIPVLTIVLTIMVRLGICMVGKVKQVRKEGKT